MPFIPYISGSIPSVIIYIPTFIIVPKVCTCQSNSQSYAVHIAEQGSREIDYNIIILLISTDHQTTTEIREGFTECMANGAPNSASKARLPILEI